MDIWVNWTKYESAYGYGTIGALTINGDRGRAYGMYQFDYRYGLVPFMQLCYNHDSTIYSALPTYIAMGAGNSALIANQGLITMFNYYANNYYSDFLYCQNQAFIEQYLNPAIAIAQSYGMRNLDNPYILGSIGSFAIRDGAYDASRCGQAIRAMAQQTTVESQLAVGYTVFQNYYAPLGDDRWYRQLAECLADMNNNTGVADMDVSPPSPPPTPPTPEPPEPVEPEGNQRVPVNYWYGVKKKSDDWMIYKGRII